MGLFSKYLLNEAKETYLSEIGDLSRFKEMGVKFFGFIKEDYIKLSNLIVPKEDRKQGVGSEFMTELTKYADRNDLTIVLSPAQKDDYHGTTSAARLRKFYGRFGFVRNLGRHKNYKFNETMIRYPK